MVSKHSVKKRFLTRGSGTAGGKQGHQNPKEVPKKGSKADKKHK